MNENIPVLYIVIPCYNEEEVLPLVSEMFYEKIDSLVNDHKVSSRSRILFVDDGSKDSTWSIIRELCETRNYFCGISLSRNRGHQNALLAGLMEAKDQCDITISIDCDGQDDIHAMDQMIEEYGKGAEIVYGVRNNRSSDSFLKRRTAESYYKLLRRLGGEIIYNHADYRLVSSRVLQEFSQYKEVNLFLRGMFPMVGFHSTCVFYERRERMAGNTHYSFRKMAKLAFDGITSISTRPIWLIFGMGCLITAVSMIMIVAALIGAVKGWSVSGQLISLSIACLLSGVQLISIGVIGEYVGKIYLETKNRPRYIVKERIRGKDEE